MATPPRRFMAWVVSDTTTNVIIQVQTLPSVPSGTIIPLSGNWVGVKPSALEWSIDGEQTWSPMANFVPSDDNTWDGDGPVATTGTMSIVVRDKNNPTAKDTTIVVVTLATELLGLDLIATNVRVGVPVSISGTWQGPSQPPSLEYITDQTTAWAPVTGANFTADGKWTGAGPTPGLVGALTMRVRRTDHTATVSNSITVTAVFADALTLDPPSTVILGDTAQIHGIWQGTKPTSLQYSTDGGGTWAGTVGSLQVTDAGGSGTWQGTGPTPAAAGNIFLKVRNPSLTSVASTIQTLTTVTPTLTIDPPAQVVAGTPFALKGQWTARQPGNLDYSINDGASWVAFTATINADGSWFGTGPTPGSAGTTPIKVRDRGHTSVISASVNGVAVASATPTLTIDTPATTVGVGVAAPISGTWTVNQPTNMEFSINGGTSWSPVGSLSTTGSAGTGTWRGTGPTQSSAGSVNVIVRDAGATSVVSAQAATITAVATSTITLNAPAPIFLGQALTFNGTWGGNQPTAIEWSDNAGSTWTTLSSPSITPDNKWTAPGPTPGNAKTYTFIVRDKNNPSVVSPPATVTVTSNELLTFRTSATTYPTNTPIPIDGTWQNRKPPGISYSLDNFKSWFATTGFSTTDNGDGTGTFQATIPGQATAGSISITILDSTNAAAKVKTPVVVTITAGTVPASISLDPIASVVINNPYTLTGKYVTTAPTAMQYTTNGGQTWTDLTGFSTNSGAGTWTGVASTPTVAGNTVFQVRDKNAPTVTSGTQTAVATATPPPASISLNAPSAVTAGGTVSLSGGWQTTKPTAIDYSIDNKATWQPLTSFSTTPPGTASSGTWFGVGPTTSAAGTLTIYVRDHNAQLVQDGPVSVTVNPVGTGGTGVQAKRLRTVTDNLGINTHGGANLYNAGNAQNTIAAMNNIGITQYRDGPLYPPGAQAAMNNAGFRACFYPLAGGINPDGRSRTAAPIATQLNIWKTNNVKAIEGTNEANYFPIKFVGSDGITYTDTYYVGSPGAPMPATARYQREAYVAAKGDPATRNLPIYNCCLGLSNLGPWQQLRDTPGPNWDWSDRAEYADAHQYSDGSPLEKSLPDHVNSDKLNFLNYSYSRTILPLPNPVGLVSTEWGIATPNPGIAGSISDQNVAAKYTWLAWVTLLQFGYQDLYLYDLFDDNNDHTKIGGMWGIYNNDYSPKPVVQVLKNVFTILRDNGPQTFTPGKLNYSFTNMPQGVIGAGPGKSVLYQDSAGAFWIFAYVSKDLWTGSAAVVNTPTTVTLNLLSAAARVTVFDPMVGTAAITGSSGAVSNFPFALNDTPIILKVS